MFLPQGRRVSLDAGKVSFSIFQYAIRQMTAHVRGQKSFFNFAVRECLDSETGGVVAKLSPEPAK